MSEPTPLDLPDGLRWVKLVCRLGRLVTDSAADADAHPDLLPVGGTLTLAASPSRVRIQEADGRWRSVEVAGRTYTIRADGELVDNEGRVGVYIPDPASLLVEPQGYAITAVVKPTGGTDWRVTFGGGTVLPDVVDLVAVSSVGSASPSVTASFDARLYALETGGGVDVSQIVEDYLTANPPAAVSDATTTTKGILRLAGDLGGTATAPTVPGLAGKANADHGHAISDVSGLQTALDGKQASGSYAAATHDHTAADIDSGAATDGHVLTADGAGGAAWEAPPAGDVGQAVEDYLTANPPDGGGSSLVQVGALELPEAPVAGQTVTVLADSSTALPPDVTWDEGGAPTVTGRMLVSLVWSGTDWVGTYGPPIPAGEAPPNPSGTAYFTDFTDQTADEAPTGFTSRWNADPTFIIRDSITGSTGGKVLEAANTQTTLRRGFLSWDTLNTDPARADFEIYTRFRITTQSSGDPARAVVLGRASGAVSSEIGYYAHTREGTTLELGRYAPSASALTSATFDYTTDQWYKILLRVRGTTVQAKIWADADPEPGSWTVTTASAHITTAGWIGLGVTARDSTIQYDVLGVGTGTTDAPRTTP